MREWVAVMGVICVANPALADWVALSGDEISTALTDVTLQYEEARQEFYASGRTLYDAGRPSWGYWAVRGDAYCSQWPPADGWACYAMARETETGALRFIGESGDTTDGIVAQ